MLIIHLDKGSVMGVYHKPSEVDEVVIVDSAETDPRFIVTVSSEVKKFNQIPKYVKDLLNADEYFVEANGSKV